MAEAAAGRGVVITHGTDTLEETAVLCDLLHGGEAPIVAHGRDPARRRRPAPTARRTCSTRSGPRARRRTAGLGALVCFGGELHAARAVRKTDSVSPRAFASPRDGPARAASARSASRSGRRRARRPPLPVAQLDARVEIVAGRRWAPTARCSTRRSPPAPTGSSSSSWAPATRRRRSSRPAARAAARVPVVACVRPERGRILRGTYGFAGAERDVRAAGLICAPALSPAAARITLMACLGAGHSRVATAAVFAADDP